MSTARRRGRRGGRGRRRGTGAGGPGPRIYTRTGDLGETGLIGGQRVPKDHLRVEAYGAVDELNAHLGLARSMVVHPDLEEVIDRIQHRLFDLGAELATPASRQTGPPSITDDEVKVLEGIIDLYQEMLPPLRAFILPAGNGIAAALHVARTVCRRAERRTVTLSRAETVRPQILKYLNRLSDLLFVIARAANARSNIPDVVWKKASPPAATTPVAKTSSPAPSPKPESSSVSGRKT